MLVECDSSVYGCNYVKTSQALFSGFFDKHFFLFLLCSTLFRTFLVKETLHFYVLMESLDTCQKYFIRQHSDILIKLEFLISRFVGKSLEQRLRNPYRQS